MFKKKSEKYKQTTEEDTWFTKTWNTKKGRASLKLGFYFIFIVFIFLIIFIKAPRKEKEQVINYNPDKIVDKSKNKIDLTSNNYHFEYEITINNQKVKYYGDKNQNIELGFKEDVNGIVKYYKENDLIYKIGLDSKELIDNLYENINLNYLSYLYINDLIKDIKPIIEENNYIYQVNDELKIAFTKENNIINLITINDKNDTYILRYSKIGEIEEIKL